MGFRATLLVVLGTSGITAGVVVAQQRPASVIGVVRDTAGFPLAGAEVFLGRTWKATANQLGQFRLDSVPPGRYPVLVRLIGFNPATSSVAVLAQEPTEVEYYLTPMPVQLAPVVVVTRRVGVYGVVGDTSYRAAVGAVVELIGTHGKIVRTDSAGRFAFPGADRGPYMMRVTFPGYRERRFLVEVQRSEGRELAVMLVPGGRPPNRTEQAAMENLRDRMLRARPLNLVPTSELAHYGTLALCDLARFRRLETQDYMVHINGTHSFENMSLCAWTADRIALAEIIPPSRVGSRSLYPAGTAPAANYAQVYLWLKQ